MPKKRIQKLLTLSPRLYELAQARAGKLGLTFSQYTRLLLAGDLRQEALTSPQPGQQTNAKKPESEKVIDQVLGKTE